MFGSSNSKTAPSVSTLRAQSSIYGVVLPVLRGTNRLTAKLIDWVDFKAIAHEQSVGGKGFGGSTVTNYTYTAAVDIALAMSQCVRIGTIWDGQGSYGKGQATEEINIPGSGYHPTEAASDNFSSDIGVSLITAQQVWVPAYDPATGLPQAGGAPGIGDGYYETQNVYTPMKRVDGAPAKGQYQVGGSGTDVVYNFNYQDAGKAARLTYALKTNIAAEFSFFSGSRPQNSWAYLRGRYPSRAVAYAGTCHVAAPSFDLGGSGTLNNLAFELVGPGVFGGGIQDAGFDECVKMVTIDPDGGCGFTADELGDLTEALDYTAAAGLFFSPIMDKQQTAASYLQDYCDAANVAPCWIEDELRLIPYGDTPLAGNGHTYIPDLTPVYDLTDDDFLAEDDEPPLKIEREDPESLSNVFEIDILDRALGYNSHPIKDRDSALIYRFGQIPASPRKYDFITEVNVGARVANHIRLRATQIDPLRVTFKLGWQYELLAPMCIVTITAKEQGWVKKPFRLKEGDEDPETGATEWIAEPVLFGSCSATLYPKETPGGSSVQRDVDPGSILPPVIFEAPDALVPNGEYELWLGICGNSANWGGCHIFASSDGNTYKNVAATYSPSRMGVLQADFPAVNGHDVTSTLDVDLGESGSALLSGTDDDRDSFRTLCYVEGAGGQYELISYKTATLVSGNRYHLTDLQRGVYGTPVLDHPAGLRFLRLDDTVTRLIFNATDVGKLAHIKATSFNHQQLAEEDEATVADYTYLIQGYYNNWAQIVANDATVGYDTSTNNGSSISVRVYGMVNGVATVGSAIHFKRSDGTTFTSPAQTWTGQALLTTFYAMLNPVSATKYLLANYSDMITAVHNGHICLGSTTTPSASNSGGTSGGGGGSNGGGSTGGRLQGL